MPRRREIDPKKYCRSCAKRLHRKVYRGRLEDLGVFKRRLYCDLLCSAVDHVKPDVAKATYHHRARRLLESACEKCGSKEKLHTHHRDRNFKNNTPENIETVCEKCHGEIHGAERGNLLASRQWIDRKLLGEVWVVCREALDVLVSHSDEQCVGIHARLQDVLHRGGQL